MSIASPIAAFLLLVAVSPAWAQKVETHPLADDAFELTLYTTGETNPAQAQQQLMPAASAACKDKPAYFGRYRFDQREDLSNPAKSTLVLKQEIRCGFQAPDELPAAADAKSDWKPGPADQANVERLSYEYFRAKDSGDLAGAYRYFSPSAVPWEQWRPITAKSNADAGSVRSRQVRKITWYVDPPSGPPGAFAAVDYEGEFDNVHLQCGYVIWRRQPNGSFLLIREETNILGRKEAAKLDPEALKAVRQKYRCPS